MDITPLSLPAAAEIQFGAGDVRHFSEDDAMSVPALQNPTRQLAARDNLIAAKVNEVVSSVNNKEQYVSLSLPNTSVAPGVEEILTNFRIPPGFEARVLNATVAAIPPSANITLNVYYAEGYGNTTGEAVVSTATEVDSGTSFYNNGEFIVTLKNIGPITLACAANVLLTVRPMGSTASLLVGSVIQGEQGQPGQQGAPGVQGIPGVGGAGSPGIVWTGPWVNGATYVVPDAVSYPLYGTLTSSYIATQTHVASPSNEPPNLTYWQPLAVGSSGSTSVSTTTNITTSGSIPNYFSHIVQATLTTGPDWQGIAINGYDGSIYATGTTAYVNMVETFIESATNNPGYNRGVGLLTGLMRVAFAGNGTITLPSTSVGARVNYSTYNVGAVASVHGTVPNIVGGLANLITAVPTTPTTITLKNLNGSPLWVEVAFSGAQSY